MWNFHLKVPRVDTSNVDEEEAVRQLVNNPDELTLAQTVKLFEIGVIKNIQVTGICNGEEVCGIYELE
jgi:hypothetical protein